MTSMATPTDSPTLTPADVARMIGARKVDLVYAHIGAGRLAAVNIGTGDVRPVWRISPAAVREFLTARASSPPPKPVSRRRTGRRKVTRYF